MSLLNKFRNVIQGTQQKVADTASRQINKYTVRQRKIGLVVFGLVSGIFCFLLIIGVVGNDGARQSLQIDSISVPQKINPFSMDSLRSLPSKVIDSLESIIKKYYTDQLH